jgi:hypothetical protein
MTGPPQMKVDVHDLSDEQNIRRFVELPKLFELLSGGRVFFPTVGLLRSLDPFECGISLIQATRKLSRRVLRREAMSLVRYLPEDYRTGDIVEDYKRCERIVERSDIAALRKHVTEMRLIVLQSGVVCNCWHLGDRESDAMWKLYTGTIGVMLVSTIGKLRAAIKVAYSRIFCSPNPQEYLIAPVRYIEPGDVQRLSKFYVERPWLLKRKSFAHEKEVRVSHQLPWIISPEDCGMLIEIDAEKLITEIVLSPFNPTWADQPLASAIHIILEKRGIAVPIRKSEHMRPPAPQSSVLDTLSLLKLRDLTGGGARLRMQPRQDLKSLATAKEAVNDKRKLRQTKKRLD